MLPIRWRWVMLLIMRQKFRKVLRQNQLQNMLLWRIPLLSQAFINVVTT